jgi:hypothetical protein
MGWLTGIEGIQAIQPGSELHQAVVPSLAEAGKSVIPFTGLTFSLGITGPDLILAASFLPTLP